MEETETDRERERGGRGGDEGKRQRRRERERERERDGRELNRRRSSSLIGVRRPALGDEILATVLFEHQPSSS